MLNRTYGKGKMTPDDSASFTYSVLYNQGVKFTASMIIGSIQFLENLKIHDSDPTFFAKLNLV
jgi:hypothetical protein